MTRKKKRKILKLVNLNMHEWKFIFFLSLFSLFFFFSFSFRVFFSALGQNFDRHLGQMRKDFLFLSFGGAKKCTNSFTLQKTKGRAHKSEKCDDEKLFFFQNPDKFIPLKYSSSCVLSICDHDESVI